MPKNTVDPVAFAGIVRMLYEAAGYRVRPLSTIGIFLVQTPPGYPIGDNFDVLVATDPTPPDFDSNGQIRPRSLLYRTFLEGIMIFGRREPIRHVNGILVVPNGVLENCPPEIMIGGHLILLRHLRDLET
ncbi:MAG: hypothetical protein V1723_02370 [Candidatus Uhrbacteria bacterium]